jgi:thymidine kinase
MIKLITGKKGSGKTKHLIEAIHSASAASNGNVVAVQLGSSLNRAINHKVRLIDIETYNIKTFDDMYGFLAGILASDYDCTHIFVDGILRIVEKGHEDLDKVGAMLGRVAKICGDCATVELTISEAEENLPESIRKYL